MSSYWQSVVENRLSRRRLLQVAAAGGAAAAAGSLFACSSGGSSGGGKSSGSSFNSGAVGDKEAADALQERFHVNHLRTLAGQKDGPKYGGIHKRAQDLPPSWDLTSASAVTLGFYGFAHNRLISMEVSDFAKDLHRWNLEPMLAKSWERAGPTTLVLHVDEAAKWQNVPPVNGRAFTAEDVVYAINAYKKAPIQAPIYRDVDTVTAPDSKTVRITLKQNAAYFEQMLSTPYNLIFSREQAESSEGMAKKPIGTGAFIFQDGQSRVGYTFTKNPNYWRKDPRTGKQLPYVDGFKGIYFADATSTVAAFRDKQIDGFSPNERSVWADVMNRNPELVSMITPPPPGYQPSIALRLDKEPWSDVRLRRAMAMSFDRDSIVESYGGLAQPAYSQDWGYFGHTKPWTVSQLGPWSKYDPQQAKQLASAAGFPNGIGRKAALVLSSPTGAQNYDIAVLVADSWRRNIGLETELKVAQDTATWNRTFYGKQYEDLAAPPYLTLGAEPDEMSYLLLHSKAGSNYTFVNDPTLDDLCVKQGNTLDVNERRTILKQIMDRDLDQMYRIFTVALNNILVRQPYVYNYVGTLYGSMGSIASEATQYIWLNQA